MLQGCLCQPPSLRMPRSRLLDTSAISSLWAWDGRHPCHPCHVICPRLLPRASPPVSRPRITCRIACFFSSPAMFKRTSFHLRGRGLARLHSSLTTCERPACHCTIYHAVEVQNTCSLEHMFTVDLVPFQNRVLPHSTCNSASFRQEDARCSSSK